MSTRYVWKKYETLKALDPSDVSQYSWYSYGAGTSGHLVGYCAAGISWNDDGTATLTGDMTELRFGTFVDANTYRYFAPARQNNVFCAYHPIGKVGNYWFGSGYGNDNDLLYLTETNTSTATKNSFTLYTQQNHQGTFVENVSSSSNDVYPTDSYDGVSGDYWYVYQGSDSIDPSAISYSTSEPKQGQPITVTVTPGSSKTKGGTVYYQYQYSTNGGTSWTDAGTKTQDTSKIITIPADAAQFRARCVASDDMGFTSATYVTGSNLTVTAPNSAPTAPGGITVPAIVAPGQEFTVSWEASIDAEDNLAGYQVEFSYNGGVSWTSVDNSVSGTSITTTVAPGNTSVLYRVRAFDAEGLYSDWTVSQSAEINQPPAAPEELSLGTIAYGDYAELSWTESTDQDGSVTGYTLQRSIDGGAFETVYAGLSLTYTDQAENWAWTSVQYRVRAEDDRGGLSDWTMSPQRQIQPGTLSLTGSVADLGRVVKSFDFTVTVNASGEFPVSGIQVVMTLDDEERLRSVVKSGDGISLPIDLWGMASGAHTIVVTASREKFTEVTGIYRFTVVPIELGEGGRLERLENTRGQAVYPITLMEGVFRKKDGKSLEMVLNELDSSGGEGASGVSSFNGRSGAVMPKSGDYTAADVGAVTMAQVTAAIQSAVLDSWEASY